MHANRLFCLKGLLFSDKKKILSALHSFLGFSIFMDRGKMDAVPPMGKGGAVGLSVYACDHNKTSLLLFCDFPCVVSGRETGCVHLIKRP